MDDDRQITSKNKDTRQNKNHWNIHRIILKMALPVVGNLEF